MPFSPRRPRPRSRTFRSSADRVRPIERVLCRADVVYDGLGTPRLDAAVVVERSSDGAATIAAIDDAASLRRAYDDASEVDVGFAISPRPVNAHTHFDLSDMPYAEGTYADFVRRVVAFGRGGGRAVAATRRGVERQLELGVHVVGDIVTDVESMRYLLEHDRLAGVAYWEVIAPDPADADPAFDRAVERLRTFRAWERPGGVRVGLAPHAPHTVSGPLLRRLAELAAANGLPWQIHVAESRAERALFRDGSGPLAELMRPLLATFEPPGCSPVAYLDGLGVLGARPTLVHAADVDADDLRRIRQSGCAVVHCPRSNVALGSPRFPWEAYARHTIDVAFGTDSLGSSPSLSPLDEVQAARELHGDRASDRALVRAAVKGGHRALGLKPPVVRRGAPARELVGWRGSQAVPLPLYTTRHTTSGSLT